MFSGYDFGGVTRLRGHAYPQITDPNKRHEIAVLLATNRKMRHKAIADRRDEKLNNIERDLAYHRLMRYEDYLFGMRLVLAEFR